MEKDDDWRGVAFRCFLVCLSGMTVMTVGLLLRMIGLLD
jgi:hypothetical protein